MLELEKGFARFESNPRASRDPEPRQSPLQAQSKDRANLGKVSRYGHTYRDDCVCRGCRKARIAEYNAMQPLSMREKVCIWGSVGAGIGIVVLFALAALAS